MRKTRLLVAFLFLGVDWSAVAWGASQDWLAQVSGKERVRPNPIAHCEDQVAAGAILYRRNCASCHGHDAHGIGKRPALATERVHYASDGELHWLLTNGQLGQGMPSWSRLPDIQRWQLVCYLHSLSHRDAAGQGVLVGPR